MQARPTTQWCAHPTHLLEVSRRELQLYAGFVREASKLRRRRVHVLLLAVQVHIEMLNLCLSRSTVTKSSKVNILTCCTPGAVSASTGHVTCLLEVLRSLAEIEACIAFTVILPPWLPRSSFWAQCDLELYKTNSRLACRWLHPQHNSH